MEIVRTGNIALVAKSPCDIEKCFEAWESILEKNSKVTGNWSYQTNLDALRSFTTFLNEYLTVKAILIKLEYVIDDDDIAWLEERGYKIDTSGKLSLYVNSLKAMQGKSNNLVTKIKSKQKELLRQVKDTSEGEHVSFQQIIANLSAKLQFPVPETITLPAYNEYVRIVKLKEKHGRVNR